MLDEIQAEREYQRVEVLKELQNKIKDSLINKLYNRYVADLADNDSKPYGKAIPYIGWFWRSCDFAKKDISIGNSGVFIGVMENNKWNYPERKLTPDEADKFIELLERVMAVSHGSGEDISFYRNKRLDDLWKWMQTLKI